MNISWQNFGEALLWSVLAGAVAWIVLTPVRRRSASGLLGSLVLVGAAASAGALLGGAHSMIIPELGWGTVLALIVFAGLVTAAAAFGVGRRLARDRAVLRQAVAEVGAGRVPAEGGRPLTSELEAVRRELSATATALAATRERERALETARRDLVSWVSHDLRTPLAGLRAMAEALEDGVVDQPELYYKQIGASVERLNQMVEDLFDLSRIQAGVLTPGAEAIALDDLVSDCLAALEPLAAARGVRLTGAVEAPATVTGSGPELNRALTNLVANAIRHTRAPGQVEVRIEVRARLAEVVVSDECGGIPAEHLARVFEVGFRGETARTPHTGLADAGTDAEDSLHSGAGLGLAITRGIVEAHDGTVDVENTAAGCRFRVRLPVTPAA